MPSEPARDSEVGFLDYWRAVWGRKWLVLGLCLTAMAASFLYTSRLPKVYVATASVLAPKDDLGGSRIAVGNNLGFGALGGTGTGGSGGRGAGSSPLSLLGDAAQSLGISFSLPSPNVSMSLAFLKSRTMREQVVEHFKRSWGPGVGSLIGPVKVEAGKDETIALSVEAPDPKLSAEVANFYFEQLQRIVTQRTLERQESEQQYYLSRIEEARKAYKAAQADLIAFQEQNRTLAIDIGTKSSIDASARGGGSVMALEIMRELKRMYLTEQHPEMIALNKQIYEMKRLLSHQLYGEAQPLPPEKPGSPQRKEFFVASAKMTPVYFKMVEFYRDFKTKEALYNFLAQNIETYKYIKMSPPIPPVDWLDKAIPPGGPSRPDVRYNVTAAGIGSLVIGIFLSLFLEYLGRVKSAERAGRARVSRGSRRAPPGIELPVGPVTAELPDGPGPAGPPPDEPRVRGPERRRPVRV